MSTLPHRSGRVKRLHQDGASEFLNTDKLMKPVLVKHNILGATSTSAAGIHRKISVVERNNRMLQDGIRTRLIQANISLLFWWFAAKDTINIGNIITYLDSPSETPYSRFYGEQPEVTNIRVFGCLAYTKLNNQ